MSDPDSHCWDTFLEIGLQCKFFLSCCKGGICPCNLKNLEKSCPIMWFFSTRLVRVRPRIWRQRPVAVHWREEGGAERAEWRWPFHWLSSHSFQTLESHWGSVGYTLQLPSLSHIIIYQDHNGDSRGCGRWGTNWSPLDHALAHRKVFILFFSWVFTFFSLHRTSTLVEAVQKWVLLVVMEQTNEALHFHCIKYKNAK